MRRIVFAAAGLLGCAAETYVETSTEPVCGWTVVVTVSSEQPGPCTWSIRSLDTEVARLRSIYGVSREPAPLCEIDTFGRIDSLEPRELVEIWAPGGTDGDAAWLATDAAECE